MCTHVTRAVNVVVVQRGDYKLYEYARHWKDTFTELSMITILLMLLVCIICKQSLS